MRALEERDLTSIQTVYNLLEQEPGAEFLEAAERRGAGVIARVPTSSGLLEGHLTPETTFEAPTTAATAPGSGSSTGCARSTS